MHRPISLGTAGLVCALAVGCREASETAPQDAGRDSDLPCEDPSSALLASGQRIVEHLAVDETHVYWSQTSSGDPAGVYRLPKQGGAAELLVESRDPLGIGALLLDGETLYFADTKLWRLAKLGGEPELVTDLAGSILDLASAGEEVFALRAAACCAEEQPAAVVAIEKGSGATRELVTARRLFGMVLDGGFVYWTGSRRAAANGSDTVPATLAKTDLESGETTVLWELAESGTGPNPLTFFGPGLVVHGAEVFFNSINVDDIAANGIYRLPSEGGAPVLLTRQGLLQYGFVQEDLLYAFGTGVSRIALADGATEAVSCGRNEASTFALAVDATHAYFASGDGTRMELRTLPK